jgi:RecJ-like exonuclease
VHSTALVHITSEAPRPEWQTIRFVCPQCAVTGTFGWDDLRTKVLRRIPRQGLDGAWTAPARCVTCNALTTFTEEVSPEMATSTRPLVTASTLMLCTQCGKSYEAVKMWSTPLGPLCPECVSKERDDAA